MRPLGGRVSNGPDVLVEKLFLLSLKTYSSVGRVTGILAQRKRLEFLYAKNSSIFTLSASKRGTVFIKRDWFQAHYLGPCISSRP